MWREIERKRGFSRRYEAEICDAKLTVDRCREATVLSLQMCGSLLERLFFFLRLWYYCFINRRHDAGRAEPLSSQTQAHCVVL
jgi:hypothetical protein